MTKQNSRPKAAMSQSLAILLDNDCEPDERLDLITKEAAAVFKVPIAMINLVTSDEIVFKACVGRTQGNKLERSGMFCSYAAMQTEPLVVTDATTHAFFKNCDLVTGSLGIRSYAGKSLKGPDGIVLGTLCLFDTKARRYSIAQLSALSALAENVERELARMLSPSKSLQPLV